MSSGLPRSDAGEGGQGEADGGQKSDGKEILEDF